MVNTSEFQRGRKKDPHRQNQYIPQPCSPSVSGSACTQVLSGKHPFSHSNEGGSCGEMGAEGCALLSLQAAVRKAKSEPARAECFGRGVSLVRANPFWLSAPWIFPFLLGFVQTL